MTTYEKRRPMNVGDQFSEERAYTNIDFFMGVIAIFGLLIIGMRHLDTWGWVNMMEGFMALIGILSLNLIKNRDFRIMKFKRFGFNSLPRLLVMLMGVVLVQVLSRLPFTMDNIDLALTIVFAAVAEELFFRGFIISIFLEVQNAVNPPDKNKIKDIIVFGKTNLNFGIIGIIGVIVSSVFFAAIHTNYYADPRMMIAVFIGGLVFGFGYMYHRCVSIRSVSKLIR